MILKKMFPLLIFVLFLPLTSSQAQWVEPNPGMETYSADIEGCDGSLHRYTVTTLGWNETTNVIRFRITIDGETRTFTLDMDVYYEHEEPADILSDPEWRSYINFFLGKLGCPIAGADFGDIAAPADPVVAQNIQTFRSQVYSVKATPRAAQTPKRPETEQTTAPQREGEAAEEQQGEEEESVSAAVSKPNETSSDVEYEFFHIDGLGGNNLAIRGGYSRTTGDGKYNFGGDFFFNRLSFDAAPDAFSNSTISLFANKRMALFQSDKNSEGELVLGGTFNFLFMDENMSQDDGMAFGFSLIGRRFWVNGNLFVAGTMLQYSKIGELGSYYFNSAALYGLPIGERLALNTSVLYTQVLQSLAGEWIKLKSPRILNLGATMSYYFSYAFALNFGIKTNLFVEDYSSFELTLGSGFRF
ncbi:hypothetical protein A2V82_05950 [candidate division KSB1 bacterium RBG_16_48_16]|nr:MAG: hypothetical protein A2V82_05950 [candidate division KSB1 bacterium RBG_16_48_16]